MRAHNWPDNAALIADIHRLGYLTGSVLDVTYGLGNFWTQYLPPDLVGCDLDPHKSPIGYPVDFTDLPFDDRSFDSVVFDPPYKLNGTPSSGDDIYGVDVRMSWRNRLSLIINGTVECSRVADRHLIIKCQDQVVSGRMIWQTDEITNQLVRWGEWCKQERFDLLRSPRPQPGQRAQKHARANYSSLLIFRRVE